MRRERRASIREPILIPAKLRYLAAVGPIRPFFKYIICFGQDVIDWLYGRRPALTPPGRLRVRVGCFLSFINIATYRAVGEEFFAYLMDLGRLRPNHHLLDVGCGQVAVPLVCYLDRCGLYEVLDIDKAAIHWCRKHLSSRYTQFNFTWIDVANAYYRPGGKFSPCEYKFPYSDSSFDLVVVKSLFTHMTPREMEHYLAEIARVLKPNGRCLATYYLLNTNTSGDVQKGLGIYGFQHKVEESCYTIDPRLPEYTLAYEEEAVRRIYGQYGLTVLNPIRYGSWSGRETFLSFQDIVVAAKGAGNPPRG